MASRVARQWLWALIWATTIVETSGSEFTNPPNSQNDLAITWLLGQTVNITWDCPLSTHSLTVQHWSGRNDPAVGSLLTSAKNVGFFVWTIGIGDNVTPEEIAKDKTFKLGISDPSGSSRSGGGFVNGGLTSRGFIIRLPPGVESKTATVTASPTASPTASSPAADPGMATETKVGLGVGLGLGIPLLILVTVLATLWIRRRARSAPGRWNHDRNPRPASPPLAAEMLPPRGWRDQ